MYSIKVTFPHSTIEECLIYVGIAGGPVYDTDYLEGAFENTNTVRDGSRADAEKTIAYVRAHIPSLDEAVMEIIPSFSDHVRIVRALSEMLDI